MMNQFGQSGRETEREEGSVTKVLVGNSGDPG